MPSRSPSPRRHERFGRDERGISLLEVVISMAVFSIGMLGLARMQVITAEATSHARRLDTATTVAHDLLGYLERVPYDHAMLTDPDPATPFEDILDEENSYYRNAPTDAHTDAELPDPDWTSVTVPCEASAPTICYPFQGYHPTGRDGGGAPLPNARPSLDLNGDLTPEFERYWWADDLPGLPVDAGMARGKVVTVMVRWLEPSTGTWHRVVAFGTRYNPSVVFRR